MLNQTSNSIPHANSHPLYRWFRKNLQGKTRIIIAWLFALWLGVSARQYPALPGVAICFLGATLRFWASGFLRKDSRPAVGGPYAYVRNPLYLGTYLMALGVAWSIENYFLLGTLSVVFAILYHYIILDEEVKLARIFGAPYELYKSAVPRFFPRLISFKSPEPFRMLQSIRILGKPTKEQLLLINPEPAHLSFSNELAQKNKAWEAYYSFLGLVGLVSFVAWLWQRYN